MSNGYQGIKVGDYVKPMRGKKRKSSVWTRSFKTNRPYKVIEKTHMPADKHYGFKKENVLVLQTGATKDDYQVVNPDEVVRVGRTSHSRKARRGNPKKKGMMSWLSGR